jgi:F-type H+-transporting ATPase subunit delta
VKNTVVARNYAEALVEVARGENALEHYGELLDAVAGAVESEPRVKAVLESPRVTKQLKQQILEHALEGRAPKALVKFLQSVVKRGRQGLLAEMSEEYQALVDHELGRVHAGVITAHQVDKKLAAFIADRLRAVVGKTVVPHLRTDPAILGGVVVRVGDRVLDGSLRRRLRLLRYRMLHADSGPPR